MEGDAAGLASYYNSRSAPFFSRLSVVCRGWWYLHKSGRMFGGEWKEETRGAATVSEILSRGILSFLFHSASPHYFQQLPSLSARPMCILLLKTYWSCSFLGTSRRLSDKRFNHLLWNYKQKQENEDTVNWEETKNRASQWMMGKSQPARPADRPTDLPSNSSKSKEAKDDTRRKMWKQKKLCVTHRMSGLERISDLVPCCGISSSVISLAWKSLHAAVEEQEEEEEAQPGQQPL